MWACSNFSAIEEDHFEKELKTIFDKLASSRAHLTRFMKETYENSLTLSEI